MNDEQDHMLPHGEGDGDDVAVDRATARRLARLRTMPVDTARVEERLRLQIGEPPTISPAARPVRLRIGWARVTRLAAAAAILLGVALAGIMLFGSGGPALASAQQMADFHEDLVSGRTAVVQVDSIDQAAKELERQWPQSPGLPVVPADHVMACCMKSVKNKKMACVLMKREGMPVTMAVARADDMRLPASSPTKVRGGITYHVQSVGRLNMVMTEKSSRWVCLIGELPSENLMDVAEQLRF
jgi:hypothetical protein